MPCSIVYGLPGKGKSLFLCQYLLQLSDKFQKRIVANFRFKPDHLVQLAKMLNLSWVCDNFDQGIVHYLSPNDFEDMLLIPDAIVAIDEVALYAPRRDGGTPKPIRDGLAMSRKLSQYLIFCCQNPTQIDEGIKEFADEIFYANGITSWSPRLRNEALIIRDCKKFTPENFKVWFGDPKLRRNPIKARILQVKSWFGVVNCLDLMTFESYDSFVDFRTARSPLPASDAPDGHPPYCNLSSNRQHRLGYWPEKIQPVAPQEESLLSFFAEPISPQEEALIKAAAKPKKRGLAQVVPVPDRPKVTLIWRIWGNNRIRPHKHSKTMKRLYALAPAEYLKSLLKIDRLLSEVAAGKYTWEVIIIRSLALIGAILFGLQVFHRV